MSKALTGNAQNKCDVFRVKKAADDSYTILAGTTGETTATANTDKAIRFDLTEEAGFNIQDDYNLNIDLTQYKDDADFWRFLKDVEPDAVSGAEEKTLVDGTVLGASSDEMLLFIWYGRKHPTDGIKTVVALGSLSGSTGSFTDKANEVSSPSVAFVGQKAKSAITLAAGLYDALLDPTEAGSKLGTLPKDKSKLVEFVAEAS